MTLYSYIGVEKEIPTHAPENTNTVALIARDTLDPGVTDEMVLKYIQNQTQDQTITMDQIEFYDKEAEIVGTFEILEQVQTGVILKHFSSLFVYQTSDFPVWEPIENDSEVPDGFTTENVMEYLKMMDDAREVNATQQQGLMYILNNCFEDTNKVELYSCWDGEEAEREQFRRTIKWEAVKKNPLLLEMREKEFIVIEK